MESVLRFGLNLSYRDVDFVRPCPERRREFFKTRARYFQHEYYTGKIQFILMGSLSHFSDLDEFYFRWLENIIIEIGKSASFPLKLYHLKCNPSKHYLRIL